MTALEKTMARKSDLQLLEILEFESEKYSQEALMAARNELGSREPDEEALSLLRLQLTEKYDRQVRRQEQEAKTKEQVATYLRASVETLHPYTPKPVATTVKLLSVYLLLVLIYQVYSNWWMLHPDYVSLASLEFIAVMALLLAGIPGLWLKRRWAWILIVIYATFQFASNAVFLGDALIRLAGEEARGSYDVGSGLEFENLLRELSPGYWIPAFTANLLASGLVLCFLNRKSLLVLFRISNSVRLRTVVIVVVVTLFLMSGLV